MTAAISIEDMVRAGNGAVLWQSAYVYSASSSIPMRLLSFLHSSRSGGPPTLLAITRKLAIELQASLPDQRCVAVPGSTWLIGRLRSQLMEFVGQNNRRAHN